MSYACISSIYLYQTNYAIHTSIRIQVYDLYAVNKGDGKPREMSKHAQSRANKATTTEAQVTLTPATIAAAFDDDDDTFTLTDNTYFIPTSIPPPTSDSATTGTTKATKTTKKSGTKKAEKTTAMSEDEKPAKKTRVSKSSGQSTPAAEGGEVNNSGEKHEHY